MSELWYKEIGFYNNPFSIKPAAYTNDVIGHSLKTIFKNIEAGAPQFIVGPFGAGKTTILKHIVGRFGGGKNVVYFSCSLERSMDVDRLVSGAGSFLSRLTGGSPKGLIFLIDEANDILPKDAQQLYAAYQDGSISSLVFVGTDVPSKKLPPGLASELKGSIINLADLPSSSSIQLVRRRVGKLSLLPDAIIKDLHKRAGGSTRLLLEYCEEACRLAVSRNLSVITKAELDELFPQQKAQAPAKRKLLHKRKRMPLEQSIEEAVFEVEDNAPVVEGLATIKDNDPLPGDELYESPLKKGRKKRST